MLEKIVLTSKNKLILPFYHLVADETPQYVTHLYKPKTTKQFKQDLNVFLAYYKTISLKRIVRSLKGNKIIKNASFHLTFDDGLQNFYTEVAPILLKKKIPATIFLNTDFVDNKDLFFRYKANLLIEHYSNATKIEQDMYRNFINEKQKTNSDIDIKGFLLGIKFKEKHFLDELESQINYSFSDFLNIKKPYLSLAQIKELQEQGFTFGAHSCNHPLYTDLSLKEQLKQTKESLNWLDENINPKQKAFSFPFHDIGVTKEFFIKMEPYLDISFGTSGFKKEEISFHLHRLDMEKSNGNTKQFLINEYLKLAVKIPLGKHKIKRD